MVEKKIVVYDLRLSYNGPLDIESFYKEVDDWITEKGMEKEITKKMEHLTPQGKEIAWTVEGWKRLEEFYKDTVRLRAQFHNVKEVTILKNGRKIRINQANVLLIFDGILETDISERWQQKPLFYFFRALFDKYVYKFHTEKYFDVIYADTHELHKRLKAFLSLYKYKVD
ncbi:hypothetical protein ISS05_02005 [Candidatus Woesearchaeota archaeon]|nr:hypothetical protein [Candidatus Woesearchaeota archaeon]